MATGGFAAKGSTFIWNNHPVLTLRNIMPPMCAVTEDDFSSHDSPDNTEEIEPGMLTAGEFTADGLMNPGDTNGQKAFIDDLQARTSRTGMVVLPAGKGMFTFEGFPKPLRGRLPYRGAGEISFTVKATGKTDFTATPATGLTNPYFALRDNGANAVTPSPAAAGDEYDYKAYLDAADTGVAVQPTATSGTIYVNGTLVATGNWSADITVAAGSWKLVTIETREDNKASKIYRIWIWRPS